MSYKNSYANMFDLIDDIFNSTFADSGLGSFRTTQPIRFNKHFQSTSFPPTNIAIDQKTKVMMIQSALSGVKEDWINLTFDGDCLKLVVDVPVEKETDNNYYIQTGLKKIAHLETSWTVDPRYFDREKVNVTFEDGLLTITIPPRDEVAPKKIPIFGNLKLDDLTKKED